jgi:hypothetical protein
MTKVKENKVWREPLYLTGRSAFFGFCSDSVVLSPALRDAVMRMKAKSRQAYGCFEVTKGYGARQSEIKVFLSVPPEKRKHSTNPRVYKGRGFAFEVEASGEVNAGIYDAFVGLTGYCGISEVQAVHVSLVGRAEFTESGAGVAQTQYVNLYGAGIKPDGKPTSIVVTHLPGVAFPDAKIAVDFTESDGAAETPATLLSYHMSLLVSGRTRYDLQFNPVRIYAGRLSPFQAFEIFSGPAESHHPAAGAGTGAGAYDTRPLMRLGSTIFYEFDAGDAAAIVKTSQEKQGCCCVIA